MRPSPERDTLLASIIPDIAEEVKIKPLSEEEFRKKIEERLEKQQEDIKALGGKADTDKVNKLEKEIEKLKKLLKK